jgi:peroxiredoxin
VQIVTVSTDKASEIRMSRGMHGLKATMLADPKLEIINLFGFQNQNINNFRMPGRPGLPVPTTLMIDGDGKVLWKDQSDNYSRRSDPEFVGAALTEHFA